MLIELTASFDPGDIADDGPYTHVQIRSFGVDLVDEEIQINTLYGTLDERTFIPGVSLRGITYLKIEATGSDFTTLIGIGDQRLLEALYDWLISEAHFDGEVIEEVS